MNAFPRLKLRANPALLASILGAAICLIGPSSVHAATIPCQSAALAQASSPGSCWTPFSSGSAFTTQLTSGAPLASDNSAVQQHIASYGWTIGPSASGFSIGAGEGTRPVYYATPSDPTMTIHCTSSEGAGTCQGANGVDINGARINVPAGAQPDSDWDAHLTVIETATGLEYDMWHASVSGSTITAGTGAQTNVDTGDGTGGGGDAANLALSAGLLRPAELESGDIDHALVVVVPCTDATGANVGYTWPATGGWGEYCGQYWNEQASTAPELGQLMKLNMTASEIAASRAPQWEQTIMTALANYGAYIEDTEGSWHNEGVYILTQASSSWTDLGQSNQWATAASSFGQNGDNLSSDVPIPAGKLEMVNTCVTRRTCAENGNAAGNSVALRGSRHSAHPHLRRSRHKTHSRHSTRGRGASRRDVHTHAGESRSAHRHHHHRRHHRRRHHHRA